MCYYNFRTIQQKRIVRMVFLIYMFPLIRRRFV
nr:MAG TPA: hypothetical protein [Caudoviricetes sp.]